MTQWLLEEAVALRSRADDTTAEDRESAERHAEMVALKKRMAG